MKYAVIDTNILIWWYKIGEVRGSRDIEDIAPLFSVITKIEALGFNDITPDESNAIEAMLNTGELIFVDHVIAQKTIELRQKYKIKTPDAIIAATAIVHNAQLWTANTDDFAQLKELKLFNPIDLEKMKS